jgi:hypothetical protein
VPLSPDRNGQGIERNLQLSAAIDLRGWKFAAAYVDLQHVWDELGHGKCSVANFTQGNKIEARFANRMRVFSLLFRNRAFQSRSSTAGLVVVAG